MVVSFLTILRHSGWIYTSLGKLAMVPLSTPKNNEIFNLRNKPLIVFDLDATLVSQFSDQLTNNPLLDDGLKISINFTFQGHKFQQAYIQLPGTTELLRHLVLHAHKPIAFFSTGLSERNEALVKELLRKSFPTDYQSALENSPVFSRHHLHRSKSGDTVKDLTVIELFWEKTFHRTIPLNEIVLVDDTFSYHVPQQNFLPAFPPRSKDGDPNRIFAIAGILDEMFQSPLSASNYLSNFGQKYDSFSSDVTQQYYEKGLKNLQKINPNLKFINDPTLFF